MTSRLNYGAIDPEARKALLGLETYQAHAGLEISLLDLVKIRASQINGCAYCLDMHWKDARASGETEERLYMISAWRESALYTERERAALAWAEAVTLLAENGVPDELYEATRTVFNEREIISLTMAAIAINSWNRINVAFRTEAGRYVSHRHEAKE
ncbi:MAG: carboxymuconolactone decarboxylase family protein [Anaerolineae bacterium]|nr:carboxymuconolactone decarboxylase family protein [Anaerolineae bacterium]